MILIDEKVNLQPFFVYFMKKWALGFFISISHDFRLRIFISVRCLAQPFFSPQSIIYSSYWAWSWKGLFSSCIFVVSISIFSSSSISLLVQLYRLYLSLYLSVLFFYFFLTIFFFQLSLLIEALTPARIGVWSMFFYGPDKEIHVNKSWLFCFFWFDPEIDRSLNPCFAQSMC